MTYNHIREYRDGDLASISQKEIHEDDLREVGEFLVQPLGTEMALRAAGSRMFVWETECGPVCIFGSTPDGEGNALIWSIPTQEALTRWRWWARNGSEYFDLCGKGFGLLYNFKDIRNTRQITWLRRFGFTFLPTVQLGEREAYPFVRIQK